MAKPPPKITAEDGAGSGQADSPKRDGPGQATGTVNGKNLLALRGEYGGLVGERFKMTGASTKPTSIVAEREFSVLMRFKIARDGTVISAVIVSPCGNAPIDEWIEKTIPKFTHVPPPPAELIRNGVYEESFEVIYTL
jgi:TonB family protein